MTAILTSNAGILDKAIKGKTGGEKGNGNDATKNLLKTNKNTISFFLSSGITFSNKEKEINKTGTSQVGTISEAQIKSKEHPLETKKLSGKTLHSSGFVDYV